MRSEKRFLVYVHTDDGKRVSRYFSDVAFAWEYFISAVKGKNKKIKFYDREFGGLVVEKEKGLRVFLFLSAEVLSSSSHLSYIPSDSVQAPEELLQILRQLSQE